MIFTTYIISLVIIKTIVTINGQSTTDSYFQSDPYINDYKYPRSKYFYIFAPRSQARDLQETESAYVEDRGQFDQYEGQAAHWPSKVVHQQPIHYYHTIPYPHKETQKHEHSFLIPILLLALLPFLIGALILLPLLFTFFTNILQLLALLQQTIQNINQTNNTGRKKRSEDIVMNPLLTTTIEKLVQQFISAQNKYNNNINKQ